MREVIPTAYGKPTEKFVHGIIKLLDENFTKYEVNDLHSQKAVYAPTVRSMDPRDANFVSFNAPMRYFPLPSKSIPPAPTMPRPETSRLRGDFGGWEE